MAKEVSRGTLVKRYLTLATGLFECAGFSGIIFGWTSLVFVLKKERYFEGLCPARNESGGGEGRNVTVTCAAQDERFALIFTLSSFTNNFVNLPNGLLFDSCGTSVTRGVGILVYTLATFMIALSSAATAYLLFPALCFAAYGGVLFLMTNMQIGNLFGEKRSTVISVYNGAFDSSSVIFLIVKILYERGLTLRSMFFFISSLSILHILRTIFLLPKRTIPYPLPQGFNYGVTCKRSSRGDVVSVSGEVESCPENAAGDGEQQQQATKEDHIKQEVQNAVIEEDFPDFRSCVCSSLFVTNCLWLSLMQLRHYLFMGTLNPMLSLLAGGNAHLISKFTNAFAITQLCGIFFAPWNGLIIDRNKKKSGRKMRTNVLQRLDDSRALILSLCLTIAQCMAFSLSASIPRLNLQYLTFLLQVINRAFLYGGHASFIATIYPTQHFGKVFGLSMAISALVSILQYPCFALVKGPLNNDPLYLNITFVILSALTFVHPLNLYLYCRKRMKSLPRSPSPTLVVAGEEIEPLSLRETDI